MHQYVMWVIFSFSPTSALPSLQAVYSKVNTMFHKVDLYNSVPSFEINKTAMARSLMVERCELVDAPDAGFCLVEGKEVTVLKVG